MRIIINTDSILKTENDECLNCEYEDEYKVEREVIGRINNITVLSAKFADNYLWSDFNGSY